MTKWFQSFARRTFVTQIGVFETAITQEIAHLKVLRRQLLGLYNEIELAIHALDMVTERAELARAAVKQRLERPDAPQPAAFNRDLRQRTGEKE